MSSFVIHLLIPTMTALSTGLFRLRDAWVWSWAAWAVDVDYLGWWLHVNYGWYNFHRALFHNIWWLLLALLVLARAWRHWERARGGPFAAFARAKPGWVLVPFMYASHLLLDVFAGGAVLFWPVSEVSYFWDFEINVDTTKPIPQPQVVSEPGTFVGVPDVSQVYRWMSAEQFGIFLLYLAAMLFLIAQELSVRRSWAATTSPAQAQTPPRRRRLQARNRRRRNA